ASARASPTRSVSGTAAPAYRIVSHRPFQNAGALNTAMKLRALTNSMPPNPETRSHWVKDSSATDTSARQAKASTASRIGVSDSRRTTGRGAAGERPVRRRAGPGGAVAVRAREDESESVVVVMASSLLRESVDERLGVAVHGADRVLRAALEQPGHVAP